MDHQKKKIDVDCDSEQVYDHLPPQHTKYPWLVSQHFNYETKAQEQTFYNIQHPLSKYRCRIPELTGKRIRACFHGWVVMSDYTRYDQLIWSLWNPQTSKMIQLPPLPILQGALYLNECCLPFPPDDPNSIFLLTTSTEPKFIYFRLINHKRKNSMWTKISYHKKLTSITGIDHCYLDCPTVSNDKIYFLSSNSRLGVRHGFETCVIHVDISVRGKMYVFNLIPLVKQPLRPPINFQEEKASFGCYRSYSFLKGSSDHLFFIYLYEKNQEIYSVYLFKLNMVSMSWEKMEKLKEDTVLFIDYPRLVAGIFSPAIPIRSESSRGGGYIHIYNWKVIKSYNVRNRTITISPMSPHMSHTGQVIKYYDIAIWSMPGYDDGLKVGECSVESSSSRRQEEEDENESCDYKVVVNDDDELEFSFPFHILEMIMKFCVDVDYLKFRATCKQLASLPVIRWSNITDILVTLQKNSLGSTTWSMILDRDRGVITITDPMFGNKYLIKTPRELFIGDVEIHDSGYGGWLLMSKNATQDIMFFNPFTGDIRKLPHQDSCALLNLCFSAPPTSPNCMVVGFTTSCMNVHIHVVSGEQSWRKLSLPYFSGDLSFPTFYGPDIYAFDEGRLKVFRWDQDTYLFNVEDHLVLNTTTTSCCYNPPTKYYLTKSDQHLLQVSVVESEKSVTVYKFNQSLMAWECLDSLGKDAIYITETSCLCIEAGIPKMENKIYFHESYSENGNIILFYSLETHRFHTFKDDNIMKASFSDLFKPKQLLLPHTWIGPSCL